MCTRKMCVDINSTESTLKSLQRNDCVPGNRFKQDCNWCFCTNTGVAVCTLRGCGIERPRIPIINLNTNSIEGTLERVRRQTTNQEKIYTQADLDNPTFTCTPSYSFKLDCNTCWCAADGKRPRFCTRIACKNNNNNNVYSTLPPLPPSKPEERALE